MVATPTNPALGFVTESQLRAIPEFAQGFVTRVGVTDDLNLKERCKAVFPRGYVEFLVQINAVFRGDVSVPGISSVAGKSWASSDNGADTVVAADLTEYGIQTPSNLWLLDGTLAGSIGSEAFENAATPLARPQYGMVNARGGVNGEARFVHGVRAIYGEPYRTTANYAGVGSTFAVAMFVRPSEWPQHNDGSVLLAHRRYNGAEETGSSYRLGFEIGLGRNDVLYDARDTGLYVRHVNAADASVQRYVVSSSARISLPHGQEYMLAVLRTSTTLKIYINGLIAADYTLDVADAAAPGNSSDMRLVLGSDWNGTRHFGGTIRNLAIWKGTQPTSAMLLNYYRVGAGFLPKA